MKGCRCSSRQPSYVSMPEEEKLFGWVGHDCKVGEIGGVSGGLVVGVAVMLALVWKWVKEMDAIRQHNGSYRLPTPYSLKLVILSNRT